MDADDELIVDVAVAEPNARVDFGREGQATVTREAASLEQLDVTRGVFLASLRPVVEMRELHVEDSRLDRVEAEVAADQTMVVLGLRSVDAENLQALR